MTLEKAKQELEKFVQLKTTLRPSFVDVLLNAEEVKHGHWMECDDRYSWECSVCHTWSVVGGHYCDWCGAKMDEVTDGSPDN